MELHYITDKNHTEVREGEKVIGRFWRMVNGQNKYAYKSLVREGVTVNSYQAVDKIMKDYKESVIHD